jgi:hypothetical protein
MQAISDTVAAILRTPHPDIKFVNTESDGKVLVIYGSRQTSQKQGSMILRWNFEFNGDSRSAIDRSSGEIRRSGTSNGKRRKEGGVRRRV